MKKKTIIYKDNKGKIQTGKVMDEGYDGYLVVTAKSEIKYIYFKQIISEKEE
jgi:hypothetical protein